MRSIGCALFVKIRSDTKAQPICSSTGFGLSWKSGSETEMTEKICKTCAWWEPPKDEWDCAGFCHHGSINRTKELDETCSNWASGPKKRWKSEHIHKSYKISVHDEIARLRAANAILVEALKSLPAMYDSRSITYGIVTEALKKTGNQ